LVHVTPPLDDLSTPAHARSCAVHRCTCTRMRCPCPEGAAGAVDFYIFLFLFWFLVFKEHDINDRFSDCRWHVPVLSIASESRIWFCQRPGHRRRPSHVVEVRLGAFFVNRSTTERLSTACDFYHFCCRDNPSVVGDAAPDTSDAWL